MKVVRVKVDMKMITEEYERYHPTNKRYEPKTSVNTMKSGIEIPKVLVETKEEEDNRNGEVLVFLEIEEEDKRYKFEDTVDFESEGI